ncbi:fungal-specific transcription factor domain-containing protein [Corynascus similis CBS 632.67]
MSSLSNRINLLEAMLKERGVVPPPAVHPPKTRQEAQARQQQEQRQGQSDGERSQSSEISKPDPPPLNQPPTPPGSGDEDVIVVEPPQPRTFLPESHMSHSRLIDPLLLQDAEAKKGTGARHLLCTRGSFIFDQSVGRTRFYGPTANSHVYAKQTNGFKPLERSDHAHRAEQLILGLKPAAYEHLMRCFWECYNSWQQVVDESAFEAGRTTRDARFYSLFLHLTILAIGFRFADWDREDLKTVMLGNRESTLHREAKALLEAEFERLGGVPSVQALLLLADLECGTGRDTTGWMYSGMANRLAFDIGLHVSTATVDMSDLERQTRRLAMTACVMFDRKWALLLGRPTSIKTQDIGADVLPKATGKPLVDSSVGTVASKAAINRQMFELLELAGKVADFQNSTCGAAHLFPTKAVEDRAYLHFVGLERLFHNWYRRLPENLAWKPVNIKSASVGFFMLHQQFHVCMILLHRPWAKYGPLSLDGTVAARYPSPGSPGTEDSTGLPSWMTPLPHHDNRASMSRSMCTQHAIRVAHIFWHHRQRFGGKRAVLTAIQHAGTAALALMAALAHKSAELDHQSNLRYLQVLSTAIYDMSHLYQPAARMYQLLKTMLVEIRSEMVKSGGFDVSSFVGRYQGSNNMLFGSSQWATGTDNTRMHSERLESIQEEDRATKRRRLSSLSSVDFSCITPSFLTNTHQGCPSSPGASQSHSVNPAALDQTPSEPNTFDLDLFHASFVDFINAGGDSTNAQEWSATDAESSAPLLIPTVSGDISALSGNFNNAPTQNSESSSSTTPPAPASAHETTPTVPVDDDTAVDKTIEEWLAEPSKATASAATDAFSQPTTTGTEQQTGELPLPTEPRSSLSHASVDGTPICRDPYVLSLETELGIGFDLGPDNVTTTTKGTSSPPGNNNDAVKDSIIVDAMDWFTTSSPPSAPNATAPSPAHASSASGSAAATFPASPGAGVSLTGETTTTKATTAAATGPPALVPPPMTPVTLDELVQSVEEAVGSARARARARAAAAAAATSASASTSNSGGAGAGSGNANIGGSGTGAESPSESTTGSAGGRNRELDFLML